MLFYILRRIAMLVPVLVGVTLVAFSLLHLVPGDPAEVLGGQEATQQDLERIRKEFGLDQPLVIQYVRFVGNAIRGDLGISIQTRHNVRELLLQRLAFTLQLSLVSIVVAAALGLLAGIVSATRQYSLFDTGSMLAALFGISMPIFWLGLLLILMFSVQLRWLPSGGTGELRHLVLPAIALGSASAALIARMTRASMLEVTRQDYIRTARAAGHGERSVIFRHALKNAMIPVLTVVGLEFGTMLGGAVLTETVFSLPGIGRLLVEGIFARDYPVVQGAMILVATTFVLVNLLTDIAYALVDPRIRYE
jgi:ABC-type dipeptide/oligopeptide/nickel transport system permease component